MFQNLSVLNNRDYRKYFLAQMVSMTGSWMQQVVVAWVVYEQTHSRTWLGVIAFCGQIPAFLMSPIAGVYCDRRDRRRVLVAVEAMAMILAFLLAALVYFKMVSVWQIAAMTAMLGVLGAFEMTARHAFSVEMVGKSDLASAISLNTILVNGSRIIGPALGGVLLGVIGAAGCFFLNGVSYLAVVYGLLTLKLGFRVARPQVDRTSGRMREAISHVRRSPEIHLMLWLAVFLAFAGLSYNVLLPVIVKDILHGSAHTLGWMTALIGIGAIAGALRSQIAVQEENAVRAVVTRIGFLGLSQILLGASTSIFVTGCALLLTGYFAMAAYPVINNAIQQRVHDSLRGRVMSLYNMTFLGAAPLGSLLAGALADRLGAGPVIVGSGTLCVAFTLVWFSTQKRRLEADLRVAS
jgi:predicted MFS family arabinose efflux permease